MSVLRYITEVIVCSGLFLVVYRWLLARKISFGLCRAFIMTSMLLAVVIPAMNVPLLPEGTFMEQAVLTGFDFLEEDLVGNTATGSETEIQVSENVAHETIPASKGFDFKVAAGIAAEVIYILVVLASLGLTV